jgi:phosphatidylglycerol:prolipoprotein diacylglycerol transferase
MNAGTLPVAHIVHRIDPLMLDIAGLGFWYYGLAYCLGFLGIYLWFRRPQSALGPSPRDALDLPLLCTLAVLIFGRAFEVIVYEWPYYTQHPSQLLSYWRGGMASHGVLLGGAAATWLFCRLRHQPFLKVADEIVIPAAVFLALGRIGNFINGQIYGSVTDVFWAVQFPGDDQLRHPVTLYESAKNFLVAAILIGLRRRWRPGQGVLLAHFVFWYGGLRVLTDCFREYSTTFWSIGAGQYFNILMTLLGVALILWRHRACRRCQGNLRKNGCLHDSMPRSQNDAQPARFHHGPYLWIKRGTFVGLLILSLTIPSSWTQGYLDQLRAEQKVASTTCLPPDTRHSVCPSHPHPPQN